MKEMIKRIRERNDGFTLAELLIVVAIILVLVAIAVPLFIGALNDAEKAVQDADVRAVKSTAVASIMMDPDIDWSDPNAPSTWEVVATVDAKGTIALTSITGVASAGEDMVDKQTGGGYAITTYVFKTELIPVTKEVTGP